MPPISMKIPMTSENTGRNFLMIYSRCMPFEEETNKVRATAMDNKWNNVWNISTESPFKQYKKKVSVRLLAVLS